MKLDYEIIKALLEEAEEKCTGQSMLDISGNAKNDPAYALRAYHAKLLVDEKFVEGFYSDAIGDILPSRIGIHNLTLQGHKLLESMRNNTLWKKINEKIKSMGIEGLKQIPALAIQFFLS